MNLYGEMNEVVALPGLLFGVNPTTIISRVAKDEIKMGYGVSSIEGLATSNVGEQFLGIACFTQVGGCAGNNSYKAGQAVNVVTSGYVWAKCKDGSVIDSIDIDKIAYLDTTTGCVDKNGTKVIGRLRSESKN